MRFFQHQTKAQAQTRRLLGLFALTVLGLVLAMNGALALTWWAVRWALNGMVCGLEIVFNLGQTLCAPDDDRRRSALALPGFAVMATGSLGWLAGRALKAAVSRQREFLADARAVQFTRSKDGLGGVLHKVAGLRDASAHTSTGRLHPAVQHMLLVSPSDAAAAHWLATHSPLSERIRRVYGRPMPPLRRQRDDSAGSRPAGLFQER